MVDDTYRIYGNRYYLEISFPWEKGTAIHVSLHSLVNPEVVVDEWKKQIPPAVYVKYRAFMPAAKKYLRMVFSR